MRYLDEDRLTWRDYLGIILLALIFLGFWVGLPS
jgi:hypothetical protein